MMRSLPTLMLCSMLVSACDTGPKAVPRNNSAVTTSEQPYGPFNDGSVAPGGALQLNNALLLNSSFTGVSADGLEADMLLRYKLRPEMLPAITPATQLVVSINDKGRLEELYRARMSNDGLEDQLEITVKPSVDGASLVVGLENLKADVVTDIPSNSIISLPTALDLQDSELATVSGVAVQLVPGSYSSAVVGDRREHRFAVRVFSENDGQTGSSVQCKSLDNLPAEKIKEFGLQPVIGLDKNAQNNFVALENGSAYPDIESPVTVSFSKESLGVYFVMDVSSSVVSSGVAHHMIDAVSRSVVSLARFSDFNYRIFGTNVYEIASLRDINFEDPAGSGTALYYSIDTALQDIENYAPSEQNKIIIAISDGSDLASRNFYPAFTSHDQVRDYIAQRIGTVRDGQNSFYNSQLSAYFLELPSPIGAMPTSNGMVELAQQSGGIHFGVNDTHGLKESLESITANVGGTYDLVYSSQQTPDDNQLELLVHAGSCSGKVQIPTQFRP